MQLKLVESFFFCKVLIFQRSVGSVVSKNKARMTSWQPRYPVRALDLGLLTMSSLEKMFLNYSC